MIRLVIALALNLLVSVSANAETIADLLARQPCVMLVSHGRNHSTTDPKFNNFWNRINASIGEFFRDAVAERGINVHAEFYPVEALDPDKKFTAIITIAVRKRCTAIIQVAAYSERADELTVDVSLNRLLIYRSEVRGGMAASVEASLYSKAYKDQTSGDFGERYIFSDAANEYAKHMLSSSEP